MSIIYEELLKKVSKPIKKEEPSHSSSTEALPKNFALDSR